MIRVVCIKDVNLKLPSGRPSKESTELFSHLSTLFDEQKADINKSIEEKLKEHYISQAEISTKFRADVVELIDDKINDKINNKADNLRQEIKIDIKNELTVVKDQLTEISDNYNTRIEQCETGIAESKRLIDSITCKFNAIENLSVDNTKLINEEIGDRIERMNNIIAVGIPEAPGENLSIDERKKLDRAYPKSIAYAPIGSSELSLAYSNRSAVLFKARLYEDCLLDIERAFKSTGYPDKLKTKLLIRQSLCLKALNLNSRLE
ncbi:hypothetical protein HCN44_007825 [Aphidius gifuensis]|uniref:Uncharacterized protein n=1 Tax=Aphidius gifuensis TaxID=684658 RepID=A0A834XMT1_APHGI|nr:hypothetical protein HCN44_007825 [Aphidius gifuensis]